MTAIRMTTTCAPTNAKRRAAWTALSITLSSNVTMEMRSQTTTAITSATTTYRSYLMEPLLLLPLPRLRALLPHRLQLLLHLLLWEASHSRSQRAVQGLSRHHLRESTAVRPVVRTIHQAPRSHLPSHRAVDISSRDGAARAPEAAPHVPSR